MKPTTDLIGKFNSLTDKTGECWIWKGHRSGSTRYGGIRIQGKNRRAHRLAYELFNGAIPSGLSVLHHCDVPLCVNPKHLFVGTQLVNMRDASEKGRTWRKLTPEKVLAIKSLAEKRVMPQTKIAIRYGVSQTTVAEINIGRKWKNLELPK